jgi:monovalent cation:H+ antiporter, CPA1 family
MEEAHHIGEVVGGVTALLLIAAGVYAFTKKVKLPFTVLLVITGMALTALSEAYPHLLPGIAEFEISPGLILFVFLPTLIFESAYNLDYRHLQHNLGPVLTLAVPGLLVSTFVIGGIVWYLTSLLGATIPFTAALLLGAILSATDPVSVVSLFKKLGAPERLTILVEGESLFNDATSIVLAAILTDIVIKAGAITAGTVLGGVASFGVIFLGGLVVGGIMAFIAGLVLGKVEEDPSIEITLTTVLAYMSFFVAESIFHVSGVMAVIAAGLVLGGWGRMKVSVKVRNYLEHFWEYMAFMANALIFLLVGLRVELHELWNAIAIVGVVILSMLISRSGVVYALTPLVGRLPGVEPVETRYQHVMFWGGLRGAIALAIVLSLPDEFALKELFVTLVIGAVLFTLLVPGLTIEALVKKLKLDVPPLPDRIASLEGEGIAKQHSLDRLPELLKGGLFSMTIAGELKEYCTTDLERTRNQMEKIRERELDHETEGQLASLRAFAEEKSVYIRLFNEGQISERTFRDMIAELTFQMDAIRHTEHLGNVHSHRSSRRGIEGFFLNICDNLPGLTGVAERARLAHIASDYERAWAHYQSSVSVIEMIERLPQFEVLPEDILDKLRSQYERWHATATRQLDQTAGQYPEFVTTLQGRQGRRIVLLAQIETIEEQEEYGTLPRPVAEGLIEDINHQLSHLRRSVEVSQLRVEPSELLRKVPFFQGVPPDKFTDIASKMRSRTFTESSTVIQQDTDGDSMFLIARGVVRVSREDNGESRDLATLMAGDFFGEMALLHREPRTATVRAITPSSLYELRRADLDEVIEKYPDMQAALHKASQQRKAEMSER